MRIKKLLFFFFSFLILSKNVFALSASSYVVMDMDSKEVLMGSNINEERLIASISKIMTAIIALENMDINTQVTVSKEVLKSTGSAVYLEVGETITLKDLLYGLMLRSGNDAAIEIAYAVSDDMDIFAQLMNDYAKKIGMKNTHFINSSGLENEDGKGNTSTSYDMALLTSYAYQNSTFREIFKTQKYETKSSKKTYAWVNKNKLLKYDYVTGGKTGFTKKARRTLVTTANINNMNIVVVTLNDPNDWLDHQALYESVKKSYQKTIILDKENFSVPNEGVFIEDKLFIKNNYTLTIHKENVNNLKIKYYIYNGQYYDNKRVGNACIYLDNKLIHTEPIYIAVGQETLRDKIKHWFQKIRI